MKNKENLIFKELSFQYMVLEQLDIYMQKNQTRHRLYILHKKQLQGIIELNVKLKCKKIKQKIQVTLGLVMTFLDIISKAQSIEEKVKIWTSFKIKICSAKDTVKRIKRKVTDRKKILAKYISDNCLVYKIYKELLKPNIENNNQLTSDQKS